MVKVPSFAPPNNEPWVPESQNAVYTIANWLVKFIRLQDTGDEEARETCAEHGIAAFEHLPDRVVFPQWVHNEQDKRFGKFDKERRWVVFEWKRLWELVPVCDRNEVSKGAALAGPPDFCTVIHDNSSDPHPWVNAMHYFICFGWKHSVQIVGFKTSSDGKAAGFINIDKLMTQAGLDPMMVGIANAAASHFSSGRLASGWKGYKQQQGAKEKPPMDGGGLFGVNNPVEHKSPVIRVLRCAQIDEFMAKLCARSGTEVPALAGTEPQAAASSEAPPTEVPALAGTEPQAYRPSLVANSVHLRPTMPPSEVPAGPPGPSPSPSGTSHPWPAPPPAKPANPCVAPPPAGP